MYIIQLCLLYLLERTLSPRIYDHIRPDLQDAQRTEINIHSMKEMVKNICLRLWCQKPDKVGTCVTTHSLSAIYGTPCGRGKICMHGNCEPEENAKTAKAQGTSAACPQGDRNQSYCYRLLLIRSQACERKEIASYCCASCRRYRPEGARLVQPRISR